MAEPQQKFTVLLPLGLDEDQAEFIARDIVEFIQKRTRKGLDKDNQPFKSYSESYVDSLDFQIAGKSKSRVNLAQSGDTIESIEVLSIDGRRIEIGMEAGSDENDKMAWLIAPDNGASRNPLGISGDDLQSIIDKHKSSSREEREEERAVDEAITRSNLVSSILARIGVRNES